VFGFCSSVIYILTISDAKLNNTILILSNIILLKTFINNINIGGSIFILYRRGKAEFCEDRSVLNRLIINSPVSILNSIDRYRELRQWSHNDKIKIIKIIEIIKTIEIIKYMRARKKRLGEFFILTDYRILFTSFRTMKFFSTQNRTIEFFCPLIY
jgi:hypothetical protein